VERAKGTIQNGDLRSPLLALALAAAVGIAAFVSGFSFSLEEQLRDGRDQLRVSPASGEIAVLEIDGRSIEALEVWPWPRQHYAKAVRELDRLGASQIAFDIDFSSPSNEVGDADFAAALADLEGGVVLPTFRQVNNAAASQTITETLPLKVLRDQAFLASVNVVPDGDGIVTHYLHGVETNGVARPSLANMVAGKPGRIDEEFRVDQAIDPATIARISFVDLLEGRVARSTVEGRRIMVGASAIELGDRYPTALFGVQPGVVVQAQAAETLLQDRVRTEASSWLLLILSISMLACSFLFRAARRRASLVAGGLGTSLVAIGLLLDQASLMYVPLAPVLVVAATFLLTHRLLQSAANTRVATLTDLASGLPNKRAMRDALSKVDQAMVAVARIKDFAQVEAILSDEGLSDLDRQIGDRLQLLVGGQTIYRLERGLFAWLAPDPSEIELADHIQAAHALFLTPFNVSDERVKLETCLGSSDVSIEDAIDASEYARRKGLQWSATADKLHEEAQFQQSLLAELDTALSDGSIHLAYQPKLRLRDNVIASAECLVRWHSQSLGPISPAEFIPVLEERDRIDKLTLFVLREAIKRIAEATTSRLALGLAVNVSARLLTDAKFVELACDLIGAMPSQQRRCITLEITESAPTDSPVEAREALAKLRDAGARISIDDYGTGHATLEYLKNFPADEIKLDQSFVRNVLHDEADKVMVRSSIELAHALSFEIVAEGVEDAETLRKLESFGCDYIQGWEVGKPVGWIEFLDALISGRGQSEPKRLRA